MEPAQRTWIRILRDRSQKDRCSWERLQRICRQLSPQVRIVHPWLAERSTVRTGAGAGCDYAPVRI